jgi:hypothetical protein
MHFLTQLDQMTAYLSNDLLKLEAGGHLHQLLSEVVPEGVTHELSDLAY